jgi:hypothetical protein
MSAPSVTATTNTKPTNNNNNNNNKKPTLFLAIFDGDGVCECKDKCISNA